MTISVCRIEFLEIPIASRVFSMANNVRVGGRGMRELTKTFGGGDSIGPL